MSVLAVFNLPTNLSYKFKHDWHQLDNLLFPILQDDSKKNLKIGLALSQNSLSGCFPWMDPPAARFEDLTSVGISVALSIRRLPGLSCQTLSHIPSQVAKGFLCLLETLKAEGCAAGNLDSKSRNLQFTCGLVLQNNYVSVNQIYIYIDLKIRQTQSILVFSIFSLENIRQEKWTPQTANSSQTTILQWIHQILLWIWLPRCHRIRMASANFISSFTF